MKKKIALDLDGVVFDSENLYRVYTEVYDIDINKSNNVIDNTKRIFQKRYNWDEKEFQDFYSKYAPTVLENANIMTGAEIVIPKLMEYFEVIIVTSRSDDEIKYAIDKFNKVNLSNVKIYNNEHKKIEKYLKEKVDYIIDDDDEICLNAANNSINALYFKNNASQKLEENEYIKNVNNWGEIYKYIMLKEFNEEYMICTKE